MASSKRNAPLGSTVLCLVPLQPFLRLILSLVLLKTLEPATSCNPVSICGDNTIGFLAKRVPFVSLLYLKDLVMFVTLVLNVTVASFLFLTHAFLVSSFILFPFM